MYPPEYVGRPSLSSTITNISIIIIIIVTLYALTPRKYPNYISVHALTFYPQNVTQ